MRTYPEVINALFSARRFGVELGTERIAKEIARGGLVPKGKVITIGGTNGKGSVARTLEALFLKNGHSVGLFTSPHLCRLTERFRVDGREVSKELLAENYHRLEQQLEGFSRLTFFERCVVIALSLMRECEILLLEVGLGGRLDGTNAVPPSFSVVTGVDYDHGEWLGDTLAKIAQEKAGIFREGVPCAIGYCGSEEGREYLLQAADDIDASPIPVNKPKSTEAFFMQNQRLAKDVFLWAMQESWTKEISDNEMDAVTLNVQHPGRYEVIRHPIWGCCILDGAHNPAGSNALATALLGSANEGRAHGIISVSDGKDIPGIIAGIGPVLKTLTVTGCSNLRCLPADTLYQEMKTLYPTVRVEPNLERALSSLPKGERKVIFGSLFLVGEAKALLQNEPQDPLWVGENMSPAHEATNC